VQFDFRPFINIWSNEIVISHDANRAFFNAVSGTRYLVRNGANAFENSTDPEHVVELHPRSATGHTIDGKPILCVVDGRSAESAGVTLKELAYIMMEAGAFWAIELDGGGSSTMFANGTIVNKPSDGTERAVINHLLIFTEEPNMSDYYEIVGTDGNNHRVRLSYDVRSAVVNYPGTTNPANITNTVKAKAGAGPGDTFTYLTNVADSTLPGGFAAKAGDRWRKVYEVGGVAVTGWTAEIHLGVVQGIKITLISAPPVPDVKPVNMEINLVAGSTVVTTFSDGSTKTETA
jgi:hypothetical protein